MWKMKTYALLRTHKILSFCVQGVVNVESVIRAQDLVMSCQSLYQLSYLTPSNMSNKVSVPQFLVSESGINQ